MRKWVTITALGLLAIVAGLLVYAPFLPALLAEGFPALTWAGRGSFVEIAGSAVPRDLGVAADARSRALVPELAQAFDVRGGQALLVFRDGHLTLEHYADGANDTTQFNSYSMAKSLVGALVYRALADGRLTSLDQTLGELLPADRGIAHVTLRRLLAMRTGIHFDEEGTLGTASGKDSDTAANPFGPLARLHFQGLAAIEPSLRVVESDDERFNYQNVNTALLGAVLERIYGQPLQALLADAIWRPAGAASAQWRRPAANQPVSAYCCIYATARDWIRIGLFLAGNGTTEQPFLPEPLWRDYLGLDVPLAERQVNHYGAHIMQNVLDRAGQDLQGPFTYLLGQNGQTLYLMPERGLVVYRAGTDLPLLHSTLYGAWNSSQPADL
jgi:CubicO group peptidase (beta-lactamase class C family)